MLSEDQSLQICQNYSVSNNSNIAASEDLKGHIPLVMESMDTSLSTTPINSFLNYFEDKYSHQYAHPMNPSMPLANSALVFTNANTMTQFQPVFLGSIYASSEMVGNQQSQPRKGSNGMYTSPSDRMETYCIQVCAPSGDQRGGSSCFQPNNGILHNPNPCMSFADQSKHTASTSSSATSKDSKVHFADDASLVNILEFDDDLESQDMRVCYWEIFARDRARFKDRIQQSEEILNPILDPFHREKIRSRNLSPTCTSSLNNSLGENEVIINENNLSNDIST